MIGARFPEDEIPFIPAKVDIADVIHTGGRLIAQEDAAAIKAAIKFHHKNADGRYSKKDLGTKFSIVKIGDLYYAIYKGVKNKKHLGKGSFGTVKLVQNIDDGSWAVIKTIVNDSGQSKKKAVAKEIVQLKKVRQFIGQLETRVSKSKNAEQDILIMKLAPGVPVDKFIQDKKRMMAPVKWLDLALQISRSVQELHGQQILHRDIKPENILFDPSTGRVTIIDYGLGLALDPEHPEHFGNRGAGSPKYMAPEIKKREKEIKPHRTKSTAGYTEIQTVTYNESTEVYALGITLVELFGFTKNNNHIDFDIDSLKRVSNPNHRAQIIKLLTRMTDPDPERRPSMEEVIDKFASLRESEIDLVSKVNILVCINVNDYIHASVFQRSETLKAAQSADEVIFCYAQNEESLTECMRLKHEFEGSGICVLPKAIPLAHGNRESINQILKENIKKLSLEKDVIYRGHYVSPLAFLEGNTYNHTKYRNLDHVVITYDHKKIAADKIAKQRKMMREKNSADIRLQFLDRFLYDLEHGNIKTYDQLYSALQQLETEMSSSLANKFGMYSDVAKKVHKVSLIIDDDARGIKKPSGPKTL